MTFYFDNNGRFGNSFETDNLGHDYEALHAAFMRFGSPVDSRYGETREMLDFRLQLSDPENCIVDRKGFSNAFMMAEIDQFIAGVHDGDILKAVSPQAASMITEKTNYGVRIGGQLSTVVDELQAHRDSRRAVAYIGYPDDLEHLRNHPAERVSRANEIACACVWHWLVRDNMVHMIVYGRSWDIVWGLCYDVTSAVAVQMAVATALELPVGTFVFHAGSAHVYERHYDLEIKKRDSQLSLPWLVPGDIRGSQRAAHDRMVAAKAYTGGIKEFYSVTA